VDDFMQDVSIFIFSVKVKKAKFELFLLERSDWLGGLAVEP
jgi:hypothetical protein